MLKPLLDAIMNDNVQICDVRAPEEGEVKNDTYVITGLAQLEDGSKRLFDLILTNDNVYINNFNQRIISLMGLGLELKEEDDSICLPCYEIVITTGIRIGARTSDPYTHCGMMSETDPSICAEVYFLEIEPIDTSITERSAIEIWCGLFYNLLEIHGSDKLDILFSLDFDWDTIFSIYNDLFCSQIDSKNLMA